MKPVVAIICCEESATSIVTRLIDAGFITRVYDRTTNNVDGLAQLGATVATTPKEAADGADVVLVLARDSLVLASVLDTADGVFAGSRTGSLIINMGTPDGESSRATETLVKSRGLRYVEAVFWGDTASMENAPTAIMAGGTAEDSAAAISVLRAICRNVIHVGPVGQANSTKLAVDCLLQCACVVAVEECIEAGMDPKFLAGLAPDVVSLARRGHESLEGIIRLLPHEGALAIGFQREAQPNRQELLEVVRREIGKRIGLVVT